MRVRPALFRALPVLSAVSLWAAFYPLHLWPLAWIALVPLFVSLLHAPAGRRTWLWLYAGGALHWALCTHWFWHVAPIGPPLSGLVRGLSWPMFAAIVRFASPPNAASRMPFWIAAPIAWVLVDWAWGNLPSLGFPWYEIGYSQIDFIFAQAADLGGVLFLGFVMVMYQALLAEAPARARTPDWRAGAWTFAAVFLALVAYGAYRRSSIPTTPGPRLLLVQPNHPVGLQVPLDATGAPDREKIRRDKDEIYRTLSEMTADALARAPAKPDLIIWSEWGLKDWVFAEDRRYRGRGLDRLRETAARHGIPLFSGVNVAESETRIFNSSLLIGPGGEVLGRFDKMRLVPFGEALPPLPFMDIFVRLFTGLPEISTFTPGRETVVLPARGLAFSPLICFETCYPDLVRECAGKGARFVVNISNDGWFKESAELDEILSISRFRAIESRIGYVRATNSGISALIDPLGRIEASIPGKSVRDTLCGRVSVTTAGSLYRLLGDWWLVPFGVFLAAGAALRFRRVP